MKSAGAKALSLEQRPLEDLPLDELEEEVVFSEWRRLRHHSSRSLHRTAALMDQLGYDPTENSILRLGVTGSKGKGTATSYASATLAAAGMKVGTVMSPGAISNADRILVQGSPVSTQLRRRALLDLAAAIDQLPAPDASSGYLAPTGLFMLLGMRLIEQAGCHAVVAESGIGGSADDLSHWPLDGVVITEIFGEHLDILGPNVQNVANDKAGLISEQTRFAVVLPQSPEAQAGINEHLQSYPGHATILPVSATASSACAHLPSGFSRLNAAAGVTAALELIQYDAAYALPSESNLLVAAKSVTYPGRLSQHPAGTAQCMVDSAVSAEGLQACLDYVHRQWGKWPDQVLVCLPEGKDLAGFIRVLEAVPTERVFVSFPGGYLKMPEPEKWPWRWCTDEALDDLLRDQDSVAVGTVLFTSAVLRALQVTSVPLFETGVFEAPNGASHG